ncbi:MAG: mechanosensitive ion channel family protein [Proteobacteria bacterium]|nr:mechanosensitive ion channel family protein [Pseudomonadota bacterium]MBU1639246.1 mechanosensitive ion channel family protein [Pseudomonadota bacterium]
MQVDMDQVVTLAWQAGAVALIVGVGFLGFYIIRRSLERMVEGGLLSQSFFRIVKSSIRWLLIIAVIAACLQQMGIKIANILAVLFTIAGMIAVGFIAVWSVLSNILCSVLLIIFRNFDIGDEIEIVEPVGGPGLKGRVVGFNIMFTILAESGGGVDAAMLTQIPNNIFFQKTLRRIPGQKTEGLGQHLLARPIKTVKCNDSE